MKTIAWKNFIAQDRIKGLFENAVANETLGHAYLLCGEAGTGTFQAALEFSMALHCGAGGAVPCYECESCRKMLRYSHPDFHVIMPAVLERDHKDSDGKLNAEGWNFLSTLILQRIAEPYRDLYHGAAPAIPVEWVKEVNHAIMRGSIEKGKNIALIDGIDMMNKESANAMLATLEEPPEDTLMLLLTNRPQAVLPTIASRCQLLRFGSLPSAVIEKCLRARYGAKAPQTVIDEALAYSLGSLGRAVDLCENPMGDLTHEAISFFGDCASGDWRRLSLRVDELARQGNEERLERLIMHVIHVFRTDMLRGGSSIGPEAPAIDCPEYAGDLFQTCQHAIDGIRAHGNLSIIMVNFITTFMEIVREQKQQLGGSRL